MKLCFQGFFRTRPGPDAVESNDSRGDLGGGGGSARA